MSEQSILVIDVGGISVKLTVGDKQPGEIHSFPTPKKMTPQQLADNALKSVSGWQYDSISIGYPGPVKRNRPWREPVNLGNGWMTFDYEAAFGRPVKMVNDAAMQALGSYRGDDMLFLGLGTGLGTALILDHQIVPLEVAHMPFRDDKTFEQLLGKAGLDESGFDDWLQDLLDAIQIFSYALCTDYVVLGGGNSQRLHKDDLPEDVHLGHNDNAFIGGFKLWD
jgi:predicted NBD/HSP70 family sugar kinase